MFKKVRCLIKRYKVIISLIIVFFLIFIFLSGTSRLDISEDDKYISFSSIIGAIIGGFFTICGVELGNEASMHQVNEQIRLTYLPCLSVKLLDKKEKNVKRTFYCGDYGGNVHVKAVIEVVNIGVGVLKDFSFSIISENKNGYPHIPIARRLEPNGSTILSCIIQYNESNAREFVDYMGRDQVVVEFQYKDLIGHEYRQQFSLIIGFSLDSRNSINNSVYEGVRITEPIESSNNYFFSFSGIKKNRLIKQKDSINKKIDAFSHEKHINIREVKLNKDEQMKFDILNRRVLKLLENEKEILQNRLLRYGAQGGVGYNSSIIKKKNSSIEIIKINENSNADCRLMLSYEYKETYNLKKETCKIRGYKIRYQIGLTFVERCKLRYIYRPRTLRDDKLKYIDAFDINGCLSELNNWKILESWEIEERLSFLLNHYERLNKREIWTLVVILYCLNVCKIVSQEFFLTGKDILSKYIIEMGYYFSYEELSHQVFIPLDIESIDEKIKAFVSEISPNLVHSSEPNLIRDWINQIGSSCYSSYLMSNVNLQEESKTFFSKIEKKEMILVLNKSNNGEFYDFTSFIREILDCSNYTKSDLDFLNELAKDLKNIHYSDSVKQYLKTTLVECVDKKYKQMDENV